MSQQPRRYRKKRVVSEDDEDSINEPDDVSQKLEEAKELQSFRKRASGISAVGLAFGKKFAEEEILVPDPFKMKTGGLVDLKKIEEKKSEDEVVKRLASQFSAETQTRDDEAHMMQYIEDEMAKRKPPVQEQSALSGYKAKVNALYALPEKLIPKDNRKSEEMLSNQMLSGIPEVDLGLAAKFKNIEETELAKQKMIEDRHSKKQSDKDSSIPSNMASNFTLHNLRFFKDRERPPSSNTNKAETQPAQAVYIPVVGISDEPELKPTVVSEGQKRKVDHSQMASDDYHYDKFKKKAKRF